MHLLRICTMTRLWSRLRRKPLLTALSLSMGGGRKFRVEHGTVTTQDRDLLWEKLAKQMAALMSRLEPEAFDTPPTQAELNAIDLRSAATLVPARVNNDCRLHVKKTAGKSSSNQRKSHTWGPSKSLLRLSLMYVLGTSNLINVRLSKTHRVCSLARWKAIPLLPM